MPRTNGASDNRVWRIRFTDTETGHNWYAGFYTSERQTKALKTRKVKEWNANPEREGMKPIEGVVEPGRIRWEASEGSD